MKQRLEILHRRFSKAVSSHSLLYFSTRPCRFPDTHPNHHDDNGNKIDHRIQYDNKKKKNPITREPWDRSFQLHKPRGQHLLTNPRILDAIVRLAGVGPTDTVLEVGPGTGNLTVRLLASAHRVVGIEVDHRMVDALRRRISDIGLDHRLDVITGDAVKTQFPEFDLCVANIPYGISSPLIGKLLFGQCCFRSATLLLQKEFARRLLAMPGDSEYNRLAANVRLVADVELLMDVSKKEFVPCPKVDSSLVRIRPRAGHPPPVDLAEWLAFTRTLFTKKNKTLGAIFKQKKKIAELFEISQIDSKGSRDAGENDGSRSNIARFDDFDDNHGDPMEINVEEKEGVDALEVGPFKEKIIRILNSGGFGEKRPSKLSNEDLLHILQLFNKEGVVFH
ncbi:ribosomal RNA small subunit methyltransferase, mitochondrial-like [Typha angustifolia]|uniref:ribosomal RNA small subunit methyltransferase, mitochondrial-like n=1 Tax=Typha angustifolia TaxID=59011 RepID=UPI003C2EE429